LHFTQHQLFPIASLYFNEEFAAIELTETDLMSVAGATAES